MLLNVGFPSSFRSRELRPIFGSGFVFAVFGESTATRALPARDTIDVLYCLLSHFTQ